MVNAKAFVPKDKNLGSWDPTASQWLQDDYTFTQKLWFVAPSLLLLLLCLSPARLSPFFRSSICRM